MVPAPDKSTLTKARIELEELYSGIPDDSVNLTFQDFAEVHQSNGGQKKNAPPHPHPPLTTEASPGKEEVTPLARMPSLDFNTGFGRSDHPVHHHHHNRPHVFPLQAQYEMEDSFQGGSPAINHLNRATSGLKSGVPNVDRGYPPVVGGGGQSTQQYQNASPYSHAGFSPAMSTGVYDDMSHMSGMGGTADKGGKHRPGIPHSNICTVCCNYIYIFRHRCLVCGRAYCRQCVGIGMGDMAEGRKCVECLGRRFSQRYIQKAGTVGCCSGYPTAVKQQELKWAEKGPRKSGENRYGGGGGGGGGGMVSQSTVKSHIARTPGRPNSTPGTTPTSFVINSPYSPYHSPINHAPF